MNKIQGFRNLTFYLEIEVQINNHVFNFLNPYEKDLFNFYFIFIN
jgi:hypothetical protein